MSEITFLYFLLHFLHNFEAFSRMCVSGLVLDKFLSTLSSPIPFHPTIRHVPHQIRPLFTPWLPPLTHPQALAVKVHSSTTYDFPAPLGATSAAASSPTLVDTTHPARKRADTSATLLEKAAASSSTVATATPYPPPQETLVQPLQFSMRLERNITRRNLPYLRDSWTRIDVIAVATFCITCVLAQTGVERGRYHIGIFLVLSIWHGDHNPLTQALRGHCTMYDDLHPVAQFGALKEFAP
ncbi:hypothetical protein EI94DRAFT_734618 [Lactarius quietus]|nr:hypothetical protein EI94DRAFT_734618 [Lactarius quietus]